MQHPLNDVQNFDNKSTGVTNTTPKSSKTTTQDVEDEAAALPSVKQAAKSDYCIQSNKRAHMVVSGCQEEYQTLVDEMPDIVICQVGPNISPHPMILGKYCLVNDNILHTDEDLIRVKPDGAISETSKFNLPIIGMSQPTRNVLRKFMNNYAGQKCLLFNVRGNPCLFSHVNDDWHPYSLHCYDQIQKLNHDLYWTGKDVEQFEADARGDILTIVKAHRESHFYFYDDITFFENQPVMRLANAPDYIMVSEEVYNGVAVGKMGSRYRRLNFVPGKFPSNREVDLLIEELRFLLHDLLPNYLALSSTENVEPLPNVVVTGHKITDGTIQLGLVMVHLVFRSLANLLASINPYSIGNMKCFTKRTKSTDSQDQTSNSSLKISLSQTTLRQLKSGQFYFIKELEQYFTHFGQIKSEVDQAIDDFSDYVNIREQILESLAKLNELRETDESDICQRIIECRMEYEYMINTMERYHLLLCFCAYLKDQMPYRLTMNFSTWMKKNPKLYQIIDYLDVSEWHASVVLLKRGQRVLVTDSSVCMDELSTNRTTSLSNFRQLAGWPIYGLAQPDFDAIHNAHSVTTKAYWELSLKNVRPTNDQRSSAKSNRSIDSNKYAVTMPKMIWVCLRDNYTIRAYGETCSWRWKRKPEDHIVLRGISGSKIEQMEKDFAASVNSLKPKCSLYDMNEFGQLTKKREDPTDWSEFVDLKQMFKLAFESKSVSCLNVSCDQTANEIPPSYCKYLNDNSEYYRIPISNYSQPPPPIFDQILRLVLANSQGLLASTNTCLSLKHKFYGIVRRNLSLGSSKISPKDDWNLPDPSNVHIDRIVVTNLLFFCENGKERTSLAMSIAGLIYCHLFGFMFGYRVEEEERTSLRDAKYTKGEFIVIERLVRMLPRGYQLKLEVDYVLDRCYDSMSMMHFHLREEIYLTYVKSKEEKNPELKQKLYKQSLVYLEKYFFLILFNAYLHNQQLDRWKMTFEDWLQQTTCQTHYMDLLNDFGFHEFDEFNKYRRIRERWKPDFLPHPTLMKDFR